MACGGVAATLAVLDDGQAVEGGPLPGGGRLRWAPPAPAYVFEFIGTTTGTASDAVARLVRESESLDPLHLRGLDWELAAFCCETCELNYCAACWDKRIEYDEGFYDCTRGRCPSGHEQLLDD